MTGSCLSTNSIWPLKMPDATGKFPLTALLGEGGMRRPRLKLTKGLVLPMRASLRNPGSGLVSTINTNLGVIRIVPAQEGGTPILAGGGYPYPGQEQGYPQTGPLTVSFGQVPLSPGKNMEWETREGTWDQRP